MDKPRAPNGTWSPAKGSYEEAVLSWQEQIELSFRRREIEAKRAVPEEGPTDGRGGETVLTSA